jgi:hypothetical protein
LVRALRLELTHTFDRSRLLAFARRWLYDHQLLVMRERAGRAAVAAGLYEHDVKELPTARRNVD